MDDQERKINREDLNLTDGKMKVCGLGFTWFGANFPDGGTQTKINKAIDANFETDLVGRAQRMEWKKKINAVFEKKYKKKN